MHNVISRNIRKERARLGWTQEHLAQAAEVNLRRIQRAEAGDGVSADGLQAIAAAFNVDVEYLRFDAVTSVRLAIAKEFSDFVQVFAADSVLLECSIDDAEIHELADDLREHLLLLLCAHGDVDAVQRGEAIAACATLASALAGLNAAVWLGLCTDLVTDRRPGEFSWLGPELLTLWGTRCFVVVARDTDPRPVVQVRAKRPPRG